MKIMTETNNMNDVCRLCLSVSPQIMCELSEDCDIISKLWSCLSVSICIIKSLPNRVCLLCVEKIEDIQNFRKIITVNQNTLMQYLPKGNADVNDFHSNLKTKLNIKQGSIGIKLLDRKESGRNFSAINNIKQENVKDFEDTVDYSSDDGLALSSIKKTKESVCTVAVKKEIATTKESNGATKTSQEKDESNSTKTENKLKTEIQNNEHKCLTCFELFFSQNHLLHHYNTIHHLKKDTGKEQPIGLTKFTTITSEDGNVRFKCGDCDRLCEDKRTMTRHLVAHSEYRPFVCKLCGRTYKTASEIIRHGRAHSDLKLDCSYQCGYSTVYLGALKEHERRHGTEYKYKCEKCGKGFQVRTWFQEHQNIHNGVKPFVCQLCGLAFHMSRYLTAHRSTVHPQSSSVKRYVCVHCNLPCDSRNALTEHLKEHGIKTSFLCDTCGKTLSNAEQLKFHTRMHQGVRPFKCSTCNKSFARRFNLTVHARTHTGERVHACARCGKRYTQRSALTRHAGRSRTDVRTTAQHCSHASHPVSRRASHPPSLPPSQPPGQQPNRPPLSRESAECLRCSVNMTTGRWPT